MDAMIKSIEAEPLGESEMRTICDRDPNVNVMSYLSLQNVTNLDRIFSSKSRKGTRSTSRPGGSKDKRACLLLYPTVSERHGHWVAIIRHSNSHIEYFDPLGNEIDALIVSPRLSSGVNAEFRYPTLQPILTNLIADAQSQGKYARVEYNKQKLQKDAPNIATCGRWCSVRSILAIHFGVCLTVFQGMWKKQSMDPDKYITILTCFSR